MYENMVLEKKKNRYTIIVVLLFLPPLFLPKRNARSVKGSVQYLARFNSSDCDNAHATSLIPAMYNKTKSVATSYQYPPKPNLRKEKTEQLLILTEVR